MAIIIIGLLLALVGMMLKKNRTELESIGKGLYWSGLVIGILGLLWSAVKQIDAGNVWESIKMISRRESPPPPNPWGHSKRFGTPPTSTSGTNTYSSARSP